MSSGSLLPGSAKGLCRRGHFTSQKAGANEIKPDCPHLEMCCLPVSARSLATFFALPLVDLDCTNRGQPVLSFSRTVSPDLPIDANQISQFRNRRKKNQCAFTPISAN